MVCDRQEKNINLCSSTQNFSIIRLVWQRELKSVSNGPLQDFHQWTIRHLELKKRLAKQGHATKPTTQLTLSTKLVFLYKITSDQSGWHHAVLNKRYFKSGHKCASGYLHTDGCDALLNVNAESDPTLLAFRMKHHRIVYSKIKVISAYRPWFQSNSVCTDKRQLILLHSHRMICISESHDISTNQLIDLLAFQTINLRLNKLCKLLKNFIRIDLSSSTWQHIATQCTALLLKLQSSLQRSRRTWIYSFTMSSLAPNCVKVSRTAKTSYLSGSLESAPISPRKRSTEQDCGMLWFSEAFNREHKVYANFTTIKMTQTWNKLFKTCLCLTT